MPFTFFRVLFFESISLSIACVCTGYSLNSDYVQARMINSAPSVIQQEENEANQNYTCRLNKLFA